MRFPWQKPEKREAGGGYTDAITSAIEARAAAQVADVSSTSAIEAVAGLLSRTFASAKVEGPSWAKEAVNPVWLAQVGRSLIREGASLSVINVSNIGQLDLTPAAFWNFEGQATPSDEIEESWWCRATTYGPSNSTTRVVPRTGLVFIRWGTSPGTRYRGQGPTSWAHTTARLQGEVERSLADEAAGPLAQLIALPQGPDDPDSDEDPLTPIRADIAKARGRALLLETTAAGWGEGRGSAPMSDWKASRLGPQPPDALVNVADAAFDRMVAACGASPALFDDSDGTSKREALRQWHMGTVIPMATILQHELTTRLETEVKLTFDGYALDLQARASTFQKLVAGGMDVDKALAISGLMLEEE